jgi:putative intracellular protease/amidase
VRSRGKIAARLGLGAAALALAACAGELVVPPAPTDPELSERQARAFVEAMKPRRPGRPVIAIVGLNEGTETTDFLLPHAVLQRADVADVQAVAPRRGRVSLYPALQAEVAQDLAGFDRAHPAGADYVIVPALRDDAAPAITTWLRAQAQRGARIIGVCVGALVVGNAGLLDGRRFTTHWYYREAVLENHPTAKYVPHQRYVIDRDVATTTGITASLPTMLALVESIGGRERAQALADELGLAAWTPAHDSTRFGLNASRRFSFLANKAKFWGHERFSVQLRDGLDDIPLALVADAWTRTGRVRVAALGASRVKLRSGMVLVPDAADGEDAPSLPLSATRSPQQQLERTLCEIRQRFGETRSQWVMMELEYAADGDMCAPESMRAAISAD